MGAFDSRHANTVPSPPSRPDRKPQTHQVAQRQPARQVLCQLQRRKLAIVANHELFQARRHAVSAVRIGREAQRRSDALHPGVPDVTRDARSGLASPAPPRSNYLPTLVWPSRPDGLQSAHRYSTARAIAGVTRAQKTQSIGHSSRTHTANIHKHGIISAMCTSVGCVPALLIGFCRIWADQLACSLKLEANGGPAPR